MTELAMKSMNTAYFNTNIFKNVNQTSWFGNISTSTWSKSTSTPSKSSTWTKLILLLSFCIPLLAQKLEFVCRPEKSKRKRHRQSLSYKLWRIIHFFQSPLVSYIYNISTDLIIIICLLFATLQLHYFIISAICVDFCITVST